MSSSVTLTKILRGHDSHCLVALYPRADKIKSSSQRCLFYYQLGQSDKKKSFKLQGSYSLFPVQPLSPSPDNDLNHTRWREYLYLTQLRCNCSIHLSFHPLRSPPTSSSQKHDLKINPGWLLSNGAGLPVARGSPPCRRFWQSTKSNPGGS